LPPPSGGQAGGQPITIRIGKVRIEWIDDHPHTTLRDPARMKPGSR
jgi:hypothetical protein